MVHQPGKGFTGMKHSAEARSGMSKSKKELVAKGWMPWNTGKTVNYSDEHKNKLRENLKIATDRKRLPQGAKLSDGHGYVWVKAKDHPSANNAGYVHEHVLIATRVLGRPLKKGEVVHHINGIKSDNRNKNLLICSVSYHRWLHGRMGFLYQREHFGHL